MDTNRPVEANRLSFRYTPDEIATVGRSASVWMLSAAGLRNAAIAVRDQVDCALHQQIVARLLGAEDTASLRNASMIGAMVMLYGMTIESLLKARYIALTPSFDPISERSRWWIGHDLRDLAAKTGWTLSRYTPEQVSILDDLSAGIHLGRYPFHFHTSRAGTMWGVREGLLVDEIVDQMMTDVLSIVVTQMERDGEKADAQLGP